MICSSEPNHLHTRTAGIFLFLPLLARLGFDKLVEQAGYPGSKMIPSDAALLSLLSLKLLRKERRSHIDDFNLDQALGLFAGLNVLPKKSFATDYSYRTQREHQQQLLHGWVRQLAPLLMPDEHAFSLDFHAIPSRADPTGLDNHYVPGRGKAIPSVQTFFAQSHENQVFCYANANLTQADQPGELMRFVDFWKELTGHDPTWLYFDSKLTTYAQLSRVNERGVKFVTIRRRGSRLLRRLEELPRSDWTRTRIDVPKRRYPNVRYYDETVTLRDYDGPIRQIAVRGLGRANPTLFLTNGLDELPRQILTNYARRNHVEAGLGTNVNFFHLDCLSGEVRLNVDLDVTLTVLGHGCYRWLAKQLRGFEMAQPKAVCRNFIETGGEIVAAPNGKIVVTFDRRSHNPILREAALDQDCPPIPWLGNRKLEFHFA